MIGKPQYSYGQTVQFDLNGEKITGKIAVIDAYGTFEQNEEVSYDIYREENNTLYKHITEKYVAPV